MIFNHTLNPIFGDILMKTWKIAINTHVEIIIK